MLQKAESTEKETIQYIMDKKNARGEVNLSNRSTHAHKGKEKFKLWFYCTYNMWLFGKCCRESSYWQHARGCFLNFWEECDHSL